MNLIYIKKLYSLNPTRYTTIQLTKALEDYHLYCESFMNSQLRRETDKLKTFKQWLLTEI